MDKQETYQDLENKAKQKYFIPDMGTDKPIEVSKAIYDAYNFLMTSLEALDKKKIKKDGNGKR